MSLTSSNMNALQPAAAGPLGHHILLELQGCPPALLKDRLVVEPVLVRAAQDAGARVVDTVFHQFNPHGLSGVVVIAESHITLHTWPEYDYAAIDIFTCGDGAIARRIHGNISRAFRAARESVHCVDRGIGVVKPGAALPSTAAL